MSIKRKIKSFILRLYNSIENNNNVDFFKNGEGVVLNQIIKNYKKDKLKIFDVGANIGEYSQMVIKSCKKFYKEFDLHLFEPVPSTASILVNNIPKESFIHVNILGLSNKNCESEIYINPQSNSLASLYPRAVNDENFSKEKITLVRLDDYCLKNHIDNIDFLKIDVEGHEIAAFEGMSNMLSQKKISTIQFEYGGANIDSRTFLKDFYELFKDYDYKIYKLMPYGVEERKYHPNMENFFYSNYIASIIDLS